MTKLMSLIVFTLAVVCEGFSAHAQQLGARYPLVNEKPQISDAHKEWKKEKSAEILSKKKIRLGGQYIDEYLDLQEKYFYSYSSWGACHKLTRLPATFSVNEYGNIEAFVGRREGLSDCPGMKYIIDPITKYVTIYDYDYATKTLIGPYARLLVSIE